MTTIRDERGDIVLGWIVRLLAGLAIVGLVLFEAGAIVVAHISADEVAARAAEDAGVEYGKRKSGDAAEHVARAYCEEHDTEFVGLFVDPDAQRVQVSVRKRAETLLADRIGALDRFTTVEATQVAPIR